MNKTWHIDNSEAMNFDTLNCKENNFGDTECETCYSLNCVLNGIRFLGFLILFLIDGY